jgi:lipoyl(octanoyl) transferase
MKEEYGLVADRKPGFPGVWVGNDKITAIGCAVKHWVTMHGFAFNVNTNLEHFKWINPCGFTDKGVTSLKKLLGEAQDMDIVMNHIIKYFSVLFNIEPEIIDKEVFLRKLEDLSDGK